VRHVVRHQEYGRLVQGCFLDCGGNTVLLCGGLFHQRGGRSVVQCRLDAFFSGLTGECSIASFLMQQGETDRVNYATQQAGKAG
jgi:hypothetical protein